MASPAAMRVFATPELLEHILLEVKSNNQANDPSYLQLFTVQRVCRTFHAVIATSKALQRNMHHITLSDELAAGWLTFVRLFIAFAEEFHPAHKDRTNSSKIPRGTSWRGIRITHPSSESFRVSSPIVFQDRGNTAVFYEDYYYAKNGHTTLGMLVDWEEPIKSRTIEEHMEARKLYRQNNHGRVGWSMSSSS